MSTWPTSDTDADLVATDVSADTCSPARARSSLLLPLAARFNALKALVNQIVSYGDPKVIPPGRLIGRTVYSGAPLNGSSSFTFTPQAATAFLVVEVQAGGGPGSYARCESLYPYVAYSSGFGGLSGAYCKALITSGFSSVSVAVGGGGKGSGPQGSGQSSSFGSLINCLGGDAYGASGTNSLPKVSGGINPGAGISVSAGVTVLASVDRACGDVGIVYSASSAIGGAGASSPMGAGGAAVVATSTSPVTGKDAAGFGAGGSGGVLLGWPANSGTSSTAWGGSGSGGCVIVYEYS